MSKLKSGVYLVRYQDIDKFFKDAENNGWKHSFEQPQEEIYDTMLNRTRDSETVKQSVIPITLDKRKRRVGYWPHKACFESEVEEAMKTWSDWCWSDKYIEFYQSKKVIL